MNIILDNLKTLYNQQFVKDVILICVTAYLTYLFTVRGNAKQRRAQFQDKISDQIATALTAVRELALETRTIEAFDGFIDCTDAKDADTFEESVFYPAFMTNIDTMYQFLRKVSDTRSKYDPYLDLISSAYLYVFERYLLGVGMFMAKSEFKDPKALGLFLIVDVQRWERRIDKHLVKRINRRHYKVSSKQGILWEIAKWYVKKTFLMKSILNKLMKKDAEFRKNIELDEPCWPADEKKEKREEEICNV